jgi:hypothetical protein
MASVLSSARGLQISEKRSAKQLDGWKSCRGSFSVARSNRQGSYTVYVVVVRLETLCLTMRRYFPTIQARAAFQRDGSWGVSTFALDCAFATVAAGQHPAATYCSCKMCCKRKNKTSSKEGHVLRCPLGKLYRRFCRMQHRQQTVPSADHPMQATVWPGT